MNEQPGVKLYGNEHVCTGPHQWGVPSNGYVICHLCYMVVEEIDPRYQSDIFIAKTYAIGNLEKVWYEQNKQHPME